MSAHARIPAAVAVACLLLARAASAGPPLFSDDPEPAPFHHWEIFTSFVGESDHGERSIDLPDLDLNYGAGPNLQLAMEVPLTWDEPPSLPTRPHLGDAVVQAKYRFLRRGAEDHEVQLATYPKLVVPEDRTWRTLGAGTTGWVLPLIGMRAFGPHARAYTDLHGTYVAAAPRRWRTFAGVAGERDASARLTWTGEIYARSAEEPHAHDVVGFNVGFIRALRPPAPDDPERGIDLVASIGRAFTGSPDLTLYVGPRFVFERPR